MSFGAGGGGSRAATLTPEQANAKYGTNYKTGDSPFGANKVAKNTTDQFITRTQQVGGMDADQYWTAVGQMRSEGVRSNPLLTPKYGEVLVKNPDYKAPEPEPTVTDTTTTIIPGTKDVSVTTRRRPERQPVNRGGAAASSLLSSASSGGALKSLLGE